MTKINSKLNVVREKSEIAGYVTMTAVRNIMKTVSSIAILIFGSIGMSIFGFVLGFFRLEGKNADN
jgi:glucose uptake protein GlcU